MFSYCLAATMALVHARRSPSARTGVASRRRKKKSGYPAGAGWKGGTKFQDEHFSARQPDWSLDSHSDLTPNPVRVGECVRRTLDAPPRPLRALPGSSSCSWVVAGSPPSVK